MITLEQHLAEHYGVGLQPTGFVECLCGESLGRPTGHVEELHNVHVAETWREARTVRTVEELDALPENSIFRVDDDGEFIEKSNGMWHFPGNEVSADYPSAWWLPALVVWTPEDGAA